MKRQYTFAVTIVAMMILSSLLVTGARLPVPGGDDDNWGEILNEFLLVSLTNEGALQNDTVSNAQLQRESVVGENIKENTITGAHIIESEITTDHIEDATIKNEDIAADARIELSKLEPLTWSLFSGVLPITQGGLGLAFTAINEGDLLVANSQNQFRTLSVGSQDHVLLGGSTPQWGPVMSQHIASDSIATRHVIDGSLTGDDFDPGSDLKVNTLTANAINAPISIALNIQTESASCSGRGCVAEASCPSGMVIITGMKSDYYSKCDGTSYPTYCRGFCEPGTTNCAVQSITSGGSSIFGASVYITCLGTS